MSFFLRNLIFRQSFFHFLYQSLWNTVRPPSGCSCPFGPSSCSFCMVLQGKLNASRELPNRHTFGPVCDLRLRSSKLGSWNSSPWTWSTSFFRKFFLGQNLCRNRNRQCPDGRSRRQYHAPAELAPPASTTWHPARGLRLAAGAAVSVWCGGGSVSHGAVIDGFAEDPSGRHWGTALGAVATGRQRGFGW